VAIATDGCNVIRPTQFSGADLGSANCKFGIFVLSCTPPRFGLSLDCRRLVEYSVRNCASPLMQLWKCFTVSLLRSVCLTVHQTTGIMKEKGRQLQRVRKTRWLSSEAIMRVSSEILAIWAALKQLSENENDAMYVVLLRLMKKIQHISFLFSSLAPHLTEQSKVFRRDVLTLHR